MVTSAEHAREDHCVDEASSSLRTGHLEDNRKRRRCCGAIVKSRAIVWYIEANQDDGYDVE